MKVSSASSTALGLVLMALMLSVSEEANELPCVTCSEAMSTMEPCMQFLEGEGSDQPSPPCCLGGLRLTEMCSTAETRKAVCECFREAKFDPPIFLCRVELLRQACVKDLPISSDPSQDCARIM